MPVAAARADVAAGEQRQAQRGERVVVHEVGPGGGRPSDAGGGKVDAAVGGDPQPLEQLDGLAARATIIVLKPSMICRLNSVIGSRPP